MDAGSRRIWRSVGWTGAVLATLVNGLVVGYGAVWFQVFGATADAEDYTVSAGGYGAAALVLALAVPAIRAHAAPRWLVWPTGSAAVVLFLLAVGSAGQAGQAEQSGSPSNTALDGLGGVLWAPWTWALMVLGIRGLYRIVIPSRSASAQSSPTGLAG